MPLLLDKVLPLDINSLCFTPHTHQFQSLERAAVWRGKIITVGYPYIDGNMEG